MCLWCNFNFPFWSTVLFLTDHNQYLKNQAVPPRPKILLLYPRDCEPFMNMMAAFREMLKQVTKCEVRVFIAFMKKKKLSLRKLIRVKRFLNTSVRVLAARYHGNLPPAVSLSFLRSLCFLARENICNVYFKLILSHVHRICHERRICMTVN